jgi:hypothetical protein
MALETLKSRLIHRIQEIEEEQIIQKIFSYIENLENEPMGPVELNHDDLVAIAEAEEDVADGKLISEEEAEAQVKKWL